MKNLTGLKFGKLTVTSFSEIRHTPNGSRKYIWNVRCDCGNNFQAESQHLRNGHTKSCSCLQKEIMRSQITHGMARQSKTHPFYTCWLNMRNRCEKHNNISYPWYGAKGIKVCERWQIFENFHEDMFSTWEKGLEIDRINGARDYEPGNCRWVTHAIQLRNTSRNHWIEFNGKKKTICDWSVELGGSPSLIRDRLSSGWSIERALTTEPRKISV